jgi:hypothetical protein
VRQFEDSRVADQRGEQARNDDRCGIHDSIYTSVYIEDKTVKGATA